MARLTKGLQALTLMQMRMTINTLSKNKVVLGLSGGVDSTTAALLLKEKGLEVIGFYFDVLGTNLKGAEAAAQLAKKLDIDFVKMDVSEEFDQTVINNFCGEYLQGRTPNPCVICNPSIKFKKLLQVAEEKGAYYIATGHYARIFHDEERDLYFIRRGANQKKDQSYMLYRLGQNVLSRLILPLGEFDDKEKTRNIARSHNLPNAETADSQEICFIDEQKENYVSYIENRGLTAEKGNFVDSQGAFLGEHQGLVHYTIGQRKGLGITLGKPAFVTSIDPETNQVTLGDNADLFKREVISSENFFAANSLPDLPEGFGDELRVLAKIRYAATPAPARVSQRPDGKILTVFDEPQRAATPGQSIVFYKEDYVFGGGFIESTSVSE